MEYGVLSLAMESLVYAELSNIILPTVPMEGSLEPPSLLWRRPPILWSVN